LIRATAPNVSAARRAAASGSASTSSDLAFEQPRHLARVGQEDRAAPPRPHRGGARRERAEHGGVEHQRRLEPLGEQSVEHVVERGPVLEAAAEHHRLRAPRPFEQGRDRARREAAFRRLLARDHPRLREAMPRPGAMLAAVAIWSLPAPALQPSGAGEQGGAGELAAAGDDEEPAAILLVAVLGWRGSGKSRSRSRSSSSSRLTAPPPSRRAPR
jgi:hypothetical protein